MNFNIKNIIKYSVLLLLVYGHQVNAMKPSEVKEAQKYLRKRTNLKSIEMLCMQIISLLKIKMKNNIVSHGYYELERNMRDLKDEGNQVVEFSGKIVNGCGLPSHLNAQLIPLLIAACQVVLIRYNIKNKHENKKMARAIYVYCAHYIIQRFRPVILI